MVNVMNATRAGGKTHMANRANARAITIKPRQPDKLVALCAMRTKPPNSHNLGTHGPFNKDGGHIIRVGRSAEHAQQSPPRTRVITRKPHPCVNVMVRRWKTRQLGLQCLETSKIHLDHSDPRVKPTAMLEKRPKEGAGLLKRGSQEARIAWMALHM